MRVTNSAMAKNYLRNLNRQTNRVLNYQDQLSSLKEVSRPSDDPLAVSKILDLKDNLSHNKQYLTTIEDSIDWTNVQDDALGKATGSMQRIRTLIQSAANDSMNDQDRQAVKSEILGEIESVIDSLNTNFGGRYVFGGQNTTEQPFKVIKDDDGNFTGIDRKDPSGNLTREIAQGVDIELFADGNQLLEFKGADGNVDNLEDFFRDVIKALGDSDTESDTEALGGDLLKRADQAFDNLLEKRVKVGATSNRLEAVKDRNETEKLNLQSMRSNKEDIDLPEKYMEFSMEMIAYQSSLQMGTRILQTNILNYL